MAILNATELKNLSDTNFPDNTSGLITPAKLREYNDNKMDSDRSYGALLTGTNVDNVGITGTPTKWAEFDTDMTQTSELFTGDLPNNQLLVTKECAILVSCTLNGRWAGGEDLKGEIYMNDAVHPITPVEAFQEGVGANDPTNFLIVRQPFPILQSYVTAGGGSAKVGLYLSSVTGNFNIDQLSIKFGFEYVPYSIRTLTP